MCGGAGMTSKKPRKPAGWWTRENVLRDAARFKSRAFWHEISRGAHGAAVRNGWLAEAHRIIDRRRLGATMDQVIADAF